MTRRSPLTLGLVLLAGATLAAGCGPGPVATTDAGGSDRDAGEPHDAGVWDAGPQDAGADAGPVDAGPTKTMVDWCRLQSPVDASAQVGEAVTVYGRVYVAGLTDRSDGVDRDAKLVAQVGYGTRGSSPGAAWHWVEASPNASWSAAAESEPGNDEWQGDLAVDGAGSFDHAFRFSYDGGSTWMYCDRNAGAGSDGSEDGYQTANAGHLDVTAPSCEPNPCTQPPAATCADATTRNVPASTGDCTIVGGQASCEYPSSPEACGTDERCVAGDCQVVAPEMVDWCRLQWPASKSAAPGTTFDVYAHVYEQGITDRTTGTDADASLLAQIGLGPRESDPSTSAEWSWDDASANPEWADASEPGNDEYMASLTAPSTVGTYDYAYRFSIDAGAHWLYCDQDGSTNGYQAAEAGKLAVEDPCTPNPCDAPPAPTCVDGATREGPTLTTGTCSVDGQGAAVCDYAVAQESCQPGELCSAGLCQTDPCTPNPCDAPPAATCSGDTLASYAATGTCTVSGTQAQCDYPQSTTDCTASQQICIDAACVTPRSVGWCIFQWAPDLTAAAGSSATFYGQVYVAGVTDRSSSADADPAVVAEFGYGPDGSDPSASSQWTWAAGAPNVGWSGGNNDEYMATITLPAAGTYDSAWRFSGDGGRTWTYCDSDGVVPPDTYSVAAAGNLVTTP